MTLLRRSEFIKKTAAAIAAAVLGPRFLAGRSARSPLPKVAARAAGRIPINEFGIIDLHCHPSLKMYVWNKKIWTRDHPSAGGNFIAMQYTVDELSSGYVRGFLATHYLIEAALESEANLLKLVFPLLRFFKPGFADKVEYEDFFNFTQINSMMDLLEQQIHTANEKQSKIEFVIARDYAEFERTLSQGKIPIAHAIEGAHALGRAFPISRKRNEARHSNPREKNVDDPTPYIRNLVALKARGVCMMTIGHILRNDGAFPVEGFSPDSKNLIGYQWAYTPAEDFPLTAIGRAVVERMLDIGMIVDLTHSTPAVRMDVFELNQRRKDRGLAMRPLTFTHAGAQKIFEKYDAQCNQNAFDNYKFYDASDEEIDLICACNGTIGIIPENFWLIGCDPALNKKDKEMYKNGIDFMVETILYINSKTRTKKFDNISIGTDFDGLADAPADLFKPSQLHLLVEKLRKHEVSPENIKKIMSGNAQRLLRDGWVNL